MKLSHFVISISIFLKGICWVEHFMILMHLGGFLSLHHCYYPSFSFFFFFFFHCV